MPELPDITLYVERLGERVVGRTLERIRIATPFVLRTVAPAPREIEGRPVTDLRRIGKRIAIGLEGDYWLVLHLMVAGRLHWHPEPVPLKGRNRLAGFDFTSGTLVLSEAGTKKRASLHLAQGPEALATHDRGGLEPLECSFAAFEAMLASENHTLKRALTNPRMFSGIGNAYSDEILHAARLSPMMQSARLDEAGRRRLYEAVRGVLGRWCERLRAETPEGFPEKVTAFRPGMSVHGRFGKPCPECGATVRRIRYKDNETNYCASCQTAGRILADRSLSRLLKDDWPRTLDD